MNDSVEQRLSLTPCLDRRGSTNRTANGRQPGYSAAMTRSDKAAAKDAGSVLVLVIRAILCPPVVDEPFVFQQFTAQGASADEFFSVPRVVVGSTFAFTESAFAYRLRTASTNEMIQVPVLAQGSDVLPLYWVAAKVANYRPLCVAH